MEKPQTFGNYLPKSNQCAATQHTRYSDRMINQLQATVSLPTGHAMVQTPQLAKKISFVVLQMPKAEQVIEKKGDIRRKIRQASS